ncbi:unnamed protein product [Effrenium voratum]|nr:unnamed protein product [Effrenium voratum]
MARSGLDGMFLGKTVGDLQQIHSQLLLMIARKHGMGKAMSIVGTSLQWLSTVCDDCAEVHVHPVDSRGKRVHPRERWHSAFHKVSELADPWQSKLSVFPLERAVRRRWAAYGWACSEVLVRLEREPFAQGAMRICHRMRALPGFNWVAKRYSSDPDVSALESDVIMQMAAKGYAERFNACNPPKKVDFIEASVLQISERPPGMRDFAVEAFLEGSFTKHSSNSGFVADEVVRNTPHAFSHFTFEASGAEQIVVDIQGVDDLYTDPQIHTASGGSRFGRGNMGLRGIALFFASHRCNSVCHQLGLTPFAHSPMPGDGAPTEYRQDEEQEPDDASITLSVQPVSLVPAKHVGNAAAQMYAKVHFALAMLHARHVQAGAEFIGHNVLTSPAQGLFHLQVAAQLGSVQGALALACLHRDLRPRKGVLKALGGALQRPLRDEAQSLKYTLQAAESGVARAMCAAGYALEMGLGCQSSKACAAGWYRAALAARNAQADEENEEEREAERLPGGHFAEHEILSALARLYEAGGDGLAPNPRLAWQFEMLAKSSARREDEEVSESSEEPPLKRATSVMRSDAQRRTMQRPNPLRSQAYEKVFDRLAAMR